MHLHVHVTFLKKPPTPLIFAPPWAGKSKTRRYRLFTPFWMHWQFSNLLCGDDTRKFKYDNGYLKNVYTERHKGNVKKISDIQTKAGNHDMFFMDTS